MQSVNGNLRFRQKFPFPFFVAIIASLTFLIFAGFSLNISNFWKRQKSLRTCARKMCMLSSKRVLHSILLFYSIVYIFPLCCIFIYLFLKLCPFPFKLSRASLFCYFESDITKCSFLEQLYFCKNLLFSNTCIPYVRSIYSLWIFLLKNSGKNK